MLGSLVACAVTPTKSSQAAGSKTGLAATADLYNNRDYPDAIRAFDNVIADTGTNANDRRLAQLGKALVYLSDDENWHSLENAKMALVAAGQVAPAGDGEFAIETDMLMDAVSAVIGTESKYVALQATSGDSNAQIARLKRERNTLTAERDELLADQKALNEALEKLKQLTLGD
jgi:hypothetical protein